MTKTMISARVDERINDDLEKLASSFNRSKAFLITEALEDYIDRQAWIVQKAERAFAEADESGEWISHEAVEKWVLSWGTENELPRPKPDIFVDKKPA
jgi:RHH-type transcriptional regulator, rel operon repressor / antitoxin RelB